MDNDLKGDLDAVEAVDTQMVMETGMKVGMMAGMSQGRGMATEVEMGKEDEDDETQVMVLPTLAHARREATVEWTSAIKLSSAMMSTMVTTVSLEGR